MIDSADSDDRIERVRQAIMLLTEDQILRLHEWAKQLVFKRLGHTATNEDYFDLYDEAIGRALSGERRWPPDNSPDLTFYLFLHETMRSIASNWAKRFRNVYRESELSASETYGAPQQSVFDRVRKDTPSVEDILAKEDIIGKIPTLVSRSTDEEVIITSWLHGMTVPEIQEAYKVTRLKCETTLRRLRRSLSAIREGLL